LFADPFVAHTVAPTNGTAANAKTGAGASTVSFVRTGSGPSSATYRYTVTATQWWDMLISRQSGNRTRYTVRLTEYQTAADAFDDNKNVPISATIYFVMDVGTRGVTDNFGKLAHILASDFLYKYNVC